METERQINFRKYGAHVSTCSVCSATPRSEESMCEYGRFLLFTYRESLGKSLETISKPRAELAKMTWSELARMQMLLEDKKDKTPEDTLMMDFIDSLIREKSEVIWFLSEEHWEGKKNDVK
jgi:hypothetical protein